MTTGIACTFYISRNGNDTWTGLRAAPQKRGKNGPFATLGRARDAVREWKARHHGALPGPVHVLLRGGVYELPVTLEFTPEDSGTAESPVTWAAYPGETVVVSGGRRLTGWATGKHKDRTAWICRIDEAMQGRWVFHQLFVNGKRRHTPCLPKEGAFRFAFCPEGTHPFWYRVGSGGFAEGDVPHFERPEEVEVVSYQFWFTNHLHIKDIDWEKRVMHFGNKGWHTLHDSDGQPCRYRLLNVKEALGEQGEWYLDRQTGELTYLPTEFEKHLEPGQNVVAPRLEAILRLKGDPERSGAKVEHLRFERLSFQHSEWRLPPENPGAIQAGFTVPGAIQLQGAAHCSFFGCEVANVGQYGIELQRGSHHNRIVACSLHDLGGGGVKINHESGLCEHPEVNDDAFDGMDTVALGWGKRFRDGGGAPRAGADESPGGFNIISDCEIRDGGEVFPSSVGIWLGDTGYNAVVHNHIHDFLYTGISVGWNWFYGPTYCAGNRIEHNHVHHIVKGGWLHDLAGIYLLGRQPGGVVKGNLVHHIDCGGYGGNTIYADQGSGFLTIEDNWMLGAPAHVFGGNNAECITVRNNLIVARAGGAQAIKQNMAECRYSYLVEDNVILTAGPDITGPCCCWGIVPPVIRWRNNLYGHLGGGRCRFHGQSFDDWMRCGHDEGSREIDPGVEAISEDGLRLAPGSALEKRLKRLPDLRAIGPRHGRLCRLPKSIDQWPWQETIFTPELPVPLLFLGEPENVDPVLKADVQRWIIEPGKPAVVIFRIINAGLVRCSGRVRLQLSPSDAGRLEEATALDYDLAPSEHASRRVMVTIEDRPGYIWLKTVSERGAAPEIGRLLAVRKEP